MEQSRTHTGVCAAEHFTLRLRQVPRTGPPLKPEFRSPVSARTTDIIAKVFGNRFQQMAQIIHPTQVAARGPFLIDQKQIESLDKILASEWARMEVARTERLAQAIEKEFSEKRNHPDYRDDTDAEIREEVRKRLTGYSEFEAHQNFLLLLRDGRYAKVSSFDEAVRDPALNDQVVTAFEVRHQSGKRSCHVVLQNNVLEVKVEPRGDALMEQTFTVLQNWHRAVRPPLWLRCWQSFSGTHFIVLLVAAAVAFGTVNDTGTNELKKQQTEQAAKIVADGVEPAEYGKALELLLTHSFSIAPSKPPPIAPKWFRWFILGTSFYMVTLSFLPKDLVGIGAGEQKIKYWRVYCRFVAVTVPLWIFTSFLWPAIQPYLKSWFGL